MFSPLAVLVHLVTKCRHFLFDFGILTSQSLPVFSVVVGNLRLGGTGKTPFVHYLSTLFAVQSGAILLRGFKRRSKGFFVVEDLSSPDEVGDEALLHFYQKIPHFSVFVGENRFEAGKQICQMEPKTQVLLLDDGFQHRAFKPTLSIVLSSFHSPFFIDFPFPLGYLREGRSALKRADVLVVTHCPEDLSEHQKNDWRQKSRPYLAFGTPLFFAGLIYGLPYSLHAQGTQTLSFQSRVILVAGIADTQELQKSAQKKFAVQASFFFPDHHIYKKEEIQKIATAYPGIPLVITEKDAVKWRFLSLDSELPIFVWPISVKMYDEEKFIAYILAKYHAFQV